MIIRAIIILLLLLSRVPAVSAQAGIDLRYPPDRTIMEFGLLALSLKVQVDPGSLIRVSLNGDEELVIVPDTSFECFTLEIETGINSISIKRVKDGKQTDRIDLNVFRRSELEVRYAKPPEEYSRVYFHEDQWQECSGCHTLEPSISDRKHVSVAAFPSDIKKIDLAAEAASSTCYTCHKGLVEFPFVHGPAAVWSCLSCHEQGAQPVYSVRKPDTKICFNCHIDQKEKWYKKKYLHGPFNTGRCAICHSPHASANPFNLIKPVWELCLSCHTGKGSGIHIVEGYMFSKDVYFHPTRGKPDPLREGRELSCASCHNAHASDTPKLWRLNVGSGFALCKACHTD